MKNGKLTTKERDKIVVIVKKKLYPVWAAIFITATKDVLNAKDVLKISNEEINQILRTANRYAGWHMDGIININDLKKDIEKDLGEKLEKLLRI